MATKSLEAQDWVAFVARVVATEEPPFELRVVILDGGELVCRGREACRGDTAGRGLGDLRGEEHEELEELGKPGKLR